MFIILKTSFLGLAFFTLSLLIVTHSNVAIKNVTGILKEYFYNNDPRNHTTLDRCLFINIYKNQERIFIFMMKMLTLKHIA